MTMMSEGFKGLLDTIDASLADNQKQLDTLAHERTRLTKCRNALVPPSASVKVPVEKPRTARTPKTPAEVTAKPRRNPNPSLPETIVGVLRACPGHEMDVVVRMVRDQRGTSKDNRAPKIVEDRIREMIVAKTIHQAPDGTLSLNVE